MSFTNLSLNDVPALNNRGVTVGNSGTAVPTSPTSDPFVPGEYWAASQTSSMGSNGKRV